MDKIIPIPFSLLRSNAAFFSPCEKLWLTYVYETKTALSETYPPRGGWGGGEGAGTSFLWAQQSCVTMQGTVVYPLSQLRVLIGPGFL